MKIVFYCSQCDYVGAAEETETHLCPRCSAVLYRTQMDREDYVALSNEEKNEVKERWKKEAGDAFGTDPKLVQTVKAALTGGNGVAAALKAIGILLYIFSALFFVFFVSGNAPTAFIVLASGIVSGTMFLGFSEIIRLLDVISKK